MSEFIVLALIAAGFIAWPIIELTMTKRRHRELQRELDEIVGGKK